jgi:hypothetical protein
MKSWRCNSKKKKKKKKSRKTLSCCPQLCSSFTSKKIKKLGSELLQAGLQQLYN